MKRATLVLVEDYPLVRQLYAEALRLEGYRVVERPTALDLGDVVAREGAAAVVLDLGLPGQGGIEACRRLKRDARVADVPVLVLTANASRDATMAAAAAGADRFLAKPLRPSALVEEIAAVLLGRSTAGATSG